MSKRATTGDKLRERAEIGSRLRLLRQHRYGNFTALGNNHVGGGCETCSALGVAVNTYRTWEAGRAMPIDAVLRLIVTSGVSPQWLLDGSGDMFSSVVNGPLSVVRFAEDGSIDDDEHGPWQRINNGQRTTNHGPTG